MTYYNSHCVNTYYQHSIGIVQYTIDGSALLV